MVFKKSLHPCSLDESRLSIGSVNPFMPVVPKTPFCFGVRVLFEQRIFQKLFEAKMVFRTQPITLLQTVFEFILNSKIIGKSIIGPDNTEISGHERIKVTFEISRHSQYV